MDSQCEDWRRVMVPILSSLPRAEAVERERSRTGGPGKPTLLAKAFLWTRAEQLLRSEQCLR